jgi:hypothetical protein
MWYQRASGGFVELQVRLPRELDDTALVDLRAWLLSERQLRGSVDLVPAENDGGHLGGAWDAVAISLGSGGAIAAFCQVITEWIKRRQPETKLECTNRFGETVSLTNIEPDAASDLLRKFCDRRDLDGGDDATT